MRSWFRRLAAILAIAAPLGAAAAQEGQPIATFESWNVHVFETPDGTTCVVASQPIDIEPPLTEVNRSQILFMVTDWPLDGVQNEIQAQMGYPLATDVTVTIDGGESFTLTRDPSSNAPEDAWMPSAVEDSMLAEAMKRGREMIVRATSTRGTDTVDTYSLIGITAALARSAAECS